MYMPSRNSNNKLYKNADLYLKKKAPQNLQLYGKTLDQKKVRIDSLPPVARDRVFSKIPFPP